MKWLFSFFALLGGIAIGLQAVINGGLGKKVGAVEGAFISFVIGTLALFFVVIFFGKGNISAVSNVPKWQLVGGLLGALYVFIMVLVVPKIGVAPALITVIAGQLLIGAVIDHFGLFGGIKMPLDFKKILAIFMLFGSILLFHFNK
ncbi:hypothetical protein PB1_00510 [Bacillus methanolicus PB1]|uniref:DMT family transporter n=1 Tax=Bacillus methanolicus PB1 TaxID=997296 RepID=I3E4G0_BACMT|nr:DMT family transporter [Bacillus methanolicus]EIJ81381.1 hypothetical protein PB1_00510 [Bacillus methanolicus PB1]